MSNPFCFLYSHYFSRGTVPYWIILLLDCFGVLCAVALSVYLEKGAVWLVLNRWKIMWGTLLIFIFFIISFKHFHTYSSVVRFSSFVDLKNVVASTLTASVLSFVVFIIFRSAEVTGIMMPDFYGICVIFVVTTMLMWVLRVGVKIIYDAICVNARTRKAFIYGTSTGAVAIAKGICSENPARYTVVGFVNPDRIPFGKYMMGARVYRDGPHLVEKMKKSDVSALLVSPLQTEHFREREELINQLLDAGIKIIVIPDSEEWDGRSDIFRTQLREVDIEDLLPRQKITVDMDGIAAQLHGKVVLITGAAGSIGSEIVRQVAVFRPAGMILIDQAETPMHDIRLMLSEQFGAGCNDEVEKVKVEAMVADISDQNFMEKIFSAYRPEYVFHAAAYKHVPMMEDNPVIAVRNNIRGTRIIADLAVKYGVKKFVMISTDKAVNPTSVMGCSKRICEIYCQSLNKAIQECKVAGVTQFVTTRFGNVLGSNGSVVHIFREQIAKGGPITVTHPDIIRFFMLIPEACKLVLEAGTMGRGGEIFVFDMGKPVRILDLARRMTALSGAGNIEIKFTGLRDGEKLYEEVLSDKENVKPTVHPKIMVASVREYDYEWACRNEERLMDATYHCTYREIVRMMEEIVPEYHSTNENYQ